MEVALSLEKLNERIGYKYERDEMRVVGIMLARYEPEITKKIVNENYMYWHDNTNIGFDIFWAGYGAYLPPSEQSGSKIILDFEENTKRVYYDRRAFITVKNELSYAFRARYKDHIQLALVNYYEGKLHFDESFMIDLEQNLDENLASIRKIIEWLTDECCREANVKTILLKMKQEELIEKIKGISISDVISTAIGMAGLKFS